MGLQDRVDDGTLMCQPVGSLSYNASNPFDIVPTSMLKKGFVYCRTCKI